MSVRSSSGNYMQGEALDKMAPFGYQGLSFLGFILLMLWVSWWAASLHQQHLIAAEQTWVPAYHFMGVDFLHSYQVSRLALAGGDPYQDFSGAPLEIKYPYAPVVIKFFSWCGLFDAIPAYIIWVTVLIFMAVFGVWAACRTRHQLCLPALPFLFLLAIFLFSTPLLFAMERGNHDILVLFFITSAALLLQKKQITAQLAAGTLLALCAWLKIYPGILILGLLALRKWKALGAFLGFGVFIGVVFYPQNLQFFENLRSLVERTAPLQLEPISTMHHAFVAYWEKIWDGTALSFLSRIPGPIGAGLVLLGMLAGVCVPVYLKRRGDPLVLPLLLWIAALGTFVPKISNDYNLVFLPLAAIAVWSWKDPWWSQILFLSLLPWWQPFQLPLSGKIMFLMKLFSLLSVGVALIVRNRSQSFSDVKVVPTYSWAWRCYQGSRHLLYASLAVMLVVSTVIVDRALARTRASTRFQEKYAAEIEESLPTNALILQMPFVPFSVNSDRIVSQGYFWGHLSTRQLRWTYSVRGREGHVWQEIAKLPLEQFVNAAISHGVTGVSIDTWGYEDAGVEIIRYLSVVSPSSAIFSDDQRFVFYKLPENSEKQ